MSYTAGEALVLSRLQGISGGVWTTSNTARGNWKILNDGISDHYAILKMGPGLNDGETFSTFARHYTTIIQIWQAYQDDGTSYTNILAFWEAILNQFDAYRKLGDTTGVVLDAHCSRWDEVMERWTKDGGPKWLSQNFYIDWIEEKQIAYAE